MWNYRWLLSVGIALTVGSMLTVAVSVGDALGAGHMKIEVCCDDASVKYSNSLWSALTKANLVGKGRYQRATL